jgi:hypothetical protein
MAELSTTPPRSITHPARAAKPVDPVIHGSRLEFAVEGEKADARVVLQLSDSSRLVMTPAAALGVAALIVRNALKAAPSTFGDERTTLARMLREAGALAAAPAAEVG